jgi:hypothetical protein
VMIFIDFISHTLPIYRWFIDDSFPMCRWFMIWFPQL